MYIKGWDYMQSVRAAQGCYQNDLVLVVERVKSQEATRAIGSVSQQYSLDMAEVRGIGL